MIIPLPEIPLPNEDHCRASGLDFSAQSRTSRKVFVDNICAPCAHVSNPNGRNPNVQNTCCRKPWQGRCSGEPSLLAIWISNFEHLNLFRVSCFEFRISDFGSPFGWSRSITSTCTATT